MPRRRYAGREGQAPEGLRSLRSLRPLPSSSASSLRDNLLPKGPSPCPCPGVDTPSGAWSPRPAPHDGNHPSGSKRGVVIFLMNVVAAGGLCGRISLRMNAFAEEFRCGGLLLRRGQGATPAAFYLGLCRLRGILSPPAPHDCAAGGPFLTAAAMTLRRSASLGLKSRIDAAFGLFLRVSLHRFPSLGLKSRITARKRTFPGKTCSDSQVWA